MDDPAAYHADGILYLPAEARFDHLLNLPEAKDIGAKAKLIEVFGNPKSKIENLKFKDIPGLCKAATLTEIESQGWSLNPGRFVGVAPGESVSDEDFKEQLETLNEELEVLSIAARGLEQTIASNVAEILET